MKSTLRRDFDPYRYPLPYEDRDPKPQRFWTFTTALILGGFVLIVWAVTR